MYTYVYVPIATSMYVIVHLGCISAQSWNRGKLSLTTNAKLQLRIKNNAEWDTPSDERERRSPLHPT